MFNITSEERKVILFLLGLAFCGIILSSLIKLNQRIEKFIYPPVELVKININQAGIQELTAIKCLPGKLAQRILEYRQQQKEFTSLGELKEIKGIGQKRYEKLKEIFFIE